MKECSDCRGCLLRVANEDVCFDYDPLDDTLMNLHQFEKTCKRAKGIICLGNYVFILILSHYAPFGANIY